MVTFRCKRSGNTVSFTNPDDIAGLRAHEGYEEVVDEAAPVMKEADEKSPSPKKRKS